MYTTSVLYGAMVFISGFSVENGHPLAVLRRDFSSRKAVKDDVIAAHHEGLAIVKRFRRFTFVVKRYNLSNSNSIYVVLFFLDVLQKYFPISTL